MRRRGMRRGKRSRIRSHSDLPPLEDKSKSQIKKESLGLQKLGEEMARLPERMIWRLGLSEDMTEAVLGIKAFGPGKARTRQIQFVGRLLRSMEEEALEKLRRSFALLQKAGIRTEPPGETG